MMRYFCIHMVEQKKHIDIVGGGIAGLAAGIYLQKNGFETTVYESHNIAGGLCTGWHRGDYTFNGCLHWLLGIRPGISFYHFWKEIIDVDSLNPIYFTERTELELPVADKNGNRKFHFYNDIDRFEEYLLSISPEDERPIRRWCNCVRQIVPELDYLPPVFLDEPFWRSVPKKMKLARLLPILLMMKRWARTSNRTFSREFKSEFLRSAVENLYENEMRMTVIFFAQAYAHKRVAAFPEGGSLAFSEMLAKSYVDAGGRLRTSTEVEKINVSDCRAVGLTLKGGETTAADFVISAAPWHATVFKLLGGQFVTSALKQLEHPQKEAIFYSFCMLHLGINDALANAPHFSRFAVEPFLSPDGTRYTQVELHIYNYDHSLAPQGKATASLNLTTREGQYWIDLRKSDPQEYRHQKQVLTQKLLTILAQRLGDDILPKIEVCELATPATYHRYTGNLNGSSQGWTPQNDITKRSAIRPTLPGLKGFVMAGQWIESGGGVPVALVSARNAAWHACNALGRKFVVSESSENQ